MAGRRSPIATYNTARQRDPATQELFAEFGRRLQAAMQTKGWNQSELARRCGQLMPKPTKGQIQNRDFGRDRISHYVRGVSMPRPESLAVIAKALGVEQGELLPDGTPGTEEKPAFAMRSVGDDRVHLSVNRTMSMALAMKITQLINAEDEKK